MPFFTALFFMGAFLLLFIQGCHKKTSDENFILITLDTQRADYISCYNSNKASTPNIDSLAQRGILYENCFSPIPITLPAHASLFFSKPPYEIKNYNNGQIIRKRKNRLSFVPIFKKSGFETAAFVSLGVLKSEFGLDNGFNLYQEDFPEERWYLSAGEVNERVFPWLEDRQDQKFFLWIHYSDPHDPYAPPYFLPDLKLFLNDKLIGEYCLKKYETHEIRMDLKTGKNRLKFEVTNEFMTGDDLFSAQLDKVDFSLQQNEESLKIDFSQGWFIRERDNKHFLKKSGIIDIYNPTPDRLAKLIFRGNLILPLEITQDFYKKEVEYMDKEIGRLWDKLDELSLFEKTHVWVVGDHGEGLGDYHSRLGGPHIGHVHYLYNVYMKVPFIIYDPHNSEKSSRIEKIVTLLDIAPTIMKVMNFKNYPDFEGRNLLQVDKMEERHLIFEETYQPEAIKNKFAVLQYPWHLIVTPEDRQYEFFNLVKDPEEKENIYGKAGMESELMKLKKRLDAFARDVLKGKEDIKIDDKTREMLRALGYIK